MHILARRKSRKSPQALTSTGIVALHEHVNDRSTRRLDYRPSYYNTDIVTSYNEQDKSYGGSGVVTPSMTPTDDCAHRSYLYYFRPITKENETKITCTNFATARPVETAARCRFANRLDTTFRRHRLLFESIIAIHILKYKIKHNKSFLYTSNYN